MRPTGTRCSSTKRTNASRWCCSHNRAQPEAENGHGLVTGPTGTRQDCDAFSKLRRRGKRRTRVCRLTGRRTPMLRVVLVTAALTTALAAPALAQSRDRGFGRSADAWCNDGSSGDRASHCEVRDATIAGNNPLDIDAGRNGGIRVRGSDRSDVLVRAKIVGYADTEADARRVVSGVRVDTAGGRVRAGAPASD